MPIQELALLNELGRLWKERVSNGSNRELNFICCYRKWYLILNVPDQDNNAVVIIVPFLWSCIWWLTHGSPQQMIGYPNSTFNEIRLKVLLEHLTSRFSPVLSNTYRLVVCYTSPLLTATVETENESCNSIYRLAINQWICECSRTSKLLLNYSKLILMDWMLRIPFFINDPSLVKILGVSNYNRRSWLGPITIS